MKPNGFKLETKFDYGGWNLLSIGIINETRIGIDDAVFEDKMAYPNFDFLIL